MSESIVTVKINNEKVSLPYSEAFKLRFELEREIMKAPEFEQLGIDVEKAFQDWKQSKN